MFSVTPQCTLTIDYIGSSTEVREFEWKFRQIELEEGIGKSSGHELSDSLPPGTNASQERDQVHMKHTFEGRLEQLINLSKRINDEILKNPACT